MNYLAKRIGIISAAVLVLSMAVFLITSHVAAQSAVIDLSINSIPFNPLPSERVNLTVQSFSTDLSQANLSWSYNGKAVASGKGRTSISVVAPASGVSGTITVTASGGNFDITTAAVVLRPASVDVIWEGADSYTAPFYKGLPTPSIGGSIRITAIPAISAPKQMSYTWRRNGEALQSASGYAKSTLLLRHDDLRDTETIEVTQASGSFTGTGSVSITPGNPVVAGYFNNEGFIDYANGSITALTTPGTGAIIHFEPYFISSPNSLARDLTFSYADAEGNALENGNPKNELRLSRPDGGRSDFSAAVSTIVFTLQNITRKFTVNFN